MKTKMEDWVQRYLPAEMISIITTLLFASVARYTTQSYLIAAIAGTFGENVGYYGFLTFQEIRNSKKHHRKTHKKYGIMAFLKNIRDLILEFGFAEWVDSGFVRPLFLYVLPKALGNFTVGVVVAKLAADLVFYCLIITAYELRKKYLRN
jgi:hypothetical protein